jgi:two-component system, sensor histidine kinase and response regulator
MALTIHTESNVRRAEPRKSLAQALLDALPTAALVADTYGRIAAVNSQAELFLGWNASTLDGQRVHEFLECRVEDSDDVSEDCPVARLLQCKAAELDGRMWIRCRDGNLRAAQFRCTPFPTVDGSGVILTFHDLTRQLELEQDLRRLACIAEESPIAIVELNEDANMIYANPAMMKLVQRFGFTCDARPAILPPNIVALGTGCLASHRESEAIEVNLEDTCYEWKLVPVAHGQMVRGYGIDRSERKRAELELVAAKAMAEVASAAKSEFLANTSHEIRSPIHVILGMADLLAASDLSEEQQWCLTTLRFSIEALSGLMGDILDMAALEAGTLAIDATPFELKPFITKQLAPFAHSAEAKGLRFELKIHEKVPARVSCDDKRFGQLLDKILSNAVKFTDAGEIVVEVDRGAIASSCKSGSDLDPNQNGAGAGFYLFVTVSDSGIGIAQEKQEAIFDRFAQADGSTNRCYEGAGLGLAIAKRLVELMGGNIGVESEPGKGSKFWLTLPMTEIVG